MKNIIQIPIDKDCNIYIVGFDQKKNEVTYRSSRNPKNKVTEKVVYNGDMAYTNQYNFHINYLNKFLIENNQ